MAAVSTFISSIKARAAFVLGANYSELGYALDVSKNSFKGNERRYAILAKAASEVPGNIGSVTIEQDFEIILTDGYINTPMSDSQAQAKAIALQDLALSIYKDLVKTKCGSNTCLSVRDCSLSEPQFIEKDNVVAQSMTVKVKYRNQLQR